MKKNFHSSGTQLCPAVKVISGDRSHANFDRRFERLRSTIFSLLGCYNGFVRVANFYLGCYFGYVRVATFYRQSRRFRSTNLILCTFEMGAIHDVILCLVFLDSNMQFRFFLFTSLTIHARERSDVGISLSRVSSVRSTYRSKTLKSESTRWSQALFVGLDA